MSSRVERRVDEDQDWTKSSLMKVMQINTSSDTKDIELEILYRRSYRGLSAPPNDTWINLIKDHIKRI